MNVILLLLFFNQTAACQVGKYRVKQGWKNIFSECLCCEVSPYVLPEEEPV